MGNEQLSLFDGVDRAPSRSEAVRPESVPRGSRPTRAQAEQPRKNGDVSSPFAEPADCSEAAEARTFPLAFGKTIADDAVMDLVRQAHKVRLPGGRWSSMPSWSELKAREIERIRMEEGERAFEDLRKATGDRKARGKLLKRRFKGDGTEIVQLTAEAERSLKIRVGLGKGFRFVDRQAGQEYLTRLFQVRKGYLEVGLSWMGLAGPWCEEWLERFRRKAEELRREVSVDDLSENERDYVDMLIRRAQILDDGRKIMEVILGQVGRQGCNPIRVPAVAFKVLLGLERDKDWKSRVEGALKALHACTFRLKSFGMESIKGYGCFVGEWRYKGAGPGDHGDGEYHLYVLPGFLGCLAVFESDKVRLDSKIEVTRFDFAKKLTKDDRKELGWSGSKKEPVCRPVSTISYYDAGRPFYESAQGLSPHQSALVALIEREITLRKDAVARGHGQHRAKPGDPDANEPRLYGREFCPLLPARKSFYAALGHFRHNPEAGRTLGGARPGLSDGSLLAVMGYELPRERGIPLDRVLYRALHDIKTVVINYLGGVAVARDAAGHWLPFEDTEFLPNSDLAHRITWFFFVPTTWREDRTRKWEARMKERADRGETPYAWKATDNLSEIVAARAQCAPVSEAGRSMHIPLCRLFRSARRRRGLRQADVGKVFGVSKQSISAWELGPEPDASGKVRGKPIPKVFVPLIARWVEEGTAPTREEVAALRSGYAGRGHGR